MRAGNSSTEHERVRALHDLRAFDAPPDERFDEFVRLAAEVCRTPMAAIAVIDHERWQARASLGLAERERPREATICAHAIVDHGVLLVRNASADDRFNHLDDVAGEPHVRFYAGAPLVTRDGHVIGTLCVLDRAARDIEPWQLDALEVLARQAVSLMQLDALSSDHAGVLDDLVIARRSLSFLATHDALTGLMNRQALAGAAVGLESANRDGSMSSAVIVIDLDNFKDINDTFGHEAGDRVLVTIGDRIHLGARGDDVVARVASDQFVVLVPNAGPLGPESMARRLLHAITAPVDLNGTNVSVTASIGISRWGGDVQSADELLRSADAAMLDAKAEGRNRYVCYERRVAHQLTRRLDAHGFVRHVMAERQLRLDFQPLWSLADGSVVARRAVLRWDVADAPALDSTAFLAAAHEVGLLNDVIRFTIHEACRDVARLRAGGEPGASVSVEMPAAQLDRDEMILVVATALTECGLEPSALVLELNSMPGLTGSASGQDTLRELQNMGVRVALADMGRGLAALASARRAPVDFIKIDPTFIETSSDVDRDVLRALVQLGEALGTTVVVQAEHTDRGASDAHEAAFRSIVATLGSSI